MANDTERNRPSLALVPLGDKSLVGFDPTGEPFDLRDGEQAAEFTRLVEDAIRGGFEYRLVSYGTGRAGLWTRAHHFWIQGGSRCRVRRTRSARRKAGE